MLSGSVLSVWFGAGVSWADADEALALSKGLLVLRPFLPAPVLVFNRTCLADLLFCVWSDAGESGADYVLVREAQKFQLDRLDVWQLF